MSSSASGPAATPKEIVELLNREIVKVIALPEVGERLDVLGFEPVGSTPARVRNWIRTELAKWGKGHPRRRKSSGFNDHRSRCGRSAIVPFPACGEGITSVRNGRGVRCGAAPEREYASFA